MPRLSGGDKLFLLSDDIVSVVRRTKIVCMFFPSKSNGFLVVGGFTERQVGGRGQRGRGTLKAAGVVLCAKGW